MSLTGVFYYTISHDKLSPVSLQLSSKENVAREELEKKWKGLCLSAEQLETLLALGNFSMELDWTHFFALGCSTFGGVSYTDLFTGVT